MINVAIMGYGTIGSGVAHIIEENKDRIKRNAEDEINLKYVLDVREFEGDPINEKIVHDYHTLSEDRDVDIVVETMGGIEPAFTFVMEMLTHGKHVVTSNKALVAAKGPELIAAAADHKVNFFFEASVGGGIPIIRNLFTCITGDEIDEISGIINGTTNFILTKMYKEGVDFDTALREAQELGYAEKDPTCRKIAILTAVVLGQQVNFEEIYTEGITRIDSADISYAKELDCCIKLIATSRRVPGQGYVAMVAPFMVENSHPLAQVNYAFNAIFVKGNMLGDSMFYGSGAGSLPTASAVLGDIVDAARHLDRHLPIIYDVEPAKLLDKGIFTGKFFIRTDSPEADVMAAFPGGRVVRTGGKSEEYGYLTEELSEADYDKNSKKINVKGMIRYK